MTPEEAERESADRQRPRRERAESDPQQLIIQALTERAVTGDPAAVRGLGSGATHHVPHHSPVDGERGAPQIRMDTDGR